MKTIIVRYPHEKDFTLTRHNDYGLEDVFNEFNAGSCNEAPEFLLAKIRSFSVGDLVFLDGKWHLCESIGWTEKTEEEVESYLSAIGEKLNELRTLENDPDLPPWFAINDVMFKIKKSTAGGRWYSKVNR